MLRRSFLGASASIFLPHYARCNVDLTETLKLYQGLDFSARMTVGYSWDKKDAIYAALSVIGPKVNRNVWSQLLPANTRINIKIPRFCQITLNAPTKEVAEYIKFVH